MFKVLYVGDPHTQISNLEDSEKLMQFVMSVARLNGVDFIVLLGDLFHTHAVVRVEVQAFWNRWLSSLGGCVKQKVIVLTGNHDMTGDASSTHSALQVFSEKPSVHVIGMGGLGQEASECVYGPLGFMPYFHDKELFVKDANRLTALGAKTIVCHQSFSGSKFENGYFDPAGINPDLLDATKIISGHIHMGQEFGKVWHPGTAMWLTSSDANQPKGIWVVDHDSDGAITERHYLDTFSVVTPIVARQWKEGEAKPEIPEGVRATVELVGSSEWIAQHKTELKGNAIKSTITDSKIKVRTAHKRFEDFVNEEFDLVSTIDKDQFMSFLKELKLV
jgi:predicted phosphodiesterase